MNDVLIIEDHPFVAESTKELITRTHPALTVTVCSSAHAALQELRDTRRSWHRILLDLDIPGAHGLSFALELAQLGFAPITCIVTAMERKDFVEQAQAFGFIGYIVKSMPAEQFADAIEKVFAGERTFSALRKARSADAAIRITRRQAEVLQLVSRGHSSKQIAMRLHLSEGTVNNHINAAMGLLGADTRSHAVAKLISLGLLAVEQWGASLQ